MEELHYVKPFPCSNAIIHIMEECFVETEMSQSFSTVVQAQVQVMDSKAGQIIYFTLDELEKNELPEALKEYIKEYIKGILPQIKDGRWHYSGNFHK